MTKTSMAIQGVFYTLKVNKTWFWYLNCHKLNKNEGKKNQHENFRK
jgi:hypothetical protein